MQTASSQLSLFSVFPGSLLRLPQYLPLTFPKWDGSPFCFFVITCTNGYNVDILIQKMILMLHYTIEKAFAGPECVFCVIVETLWCSVIPSRKETTPECSSSYCPTAITDQRHDQNHRTLRQIVAFNSRLLAQPYGSARTDCKIADPLKIKASKAQSCCPPTDWLQCTDESSVYWDRCDLSMATVTPQDIEGRLQRGALFGTRWELDRLF